MAMKPKVMDALLKVLEQLKPVPSPCAPEVREWWDKTALPLLRDQSLSELRRNDDYPPRIMGFMEGGGMGVVNVSEAMGGEWGSVLSKDITAHIHRIAAVVPGTYASVFCSEAWGLRANKAGEFERQREKYPSLGDHPDAYEMVVFQMLHYERETNRMMQLSTMIEILKVFAARRTPHTWLHTKLADKVDTTDPLDTSKGATMTGRFVFGDPEKPT
jgi:hypothetical protein